LKHRIIDFVELIAPLSVGKIMVVMECLNVEECDHLEIMSELSEIMDLKVDDEYDEWEDFLEYGFVVKEGEPKPEVIAEALILIEYFRKERFQSLIQADLFVDGICQASSWNGEDCECKMPDKMLKQTKSVLIRFPVEKTRQNTDVETKQP
jgi:hypothetical protein